MRYLMTHAAAALICGTALLLGGCGDDEDPSVRTIFLPAVTDANQAPATDANRTAQPAASSTTTTPSSTTF